MVGVPEERPARLCSCLDVLTSGETQFMLYHSWPGRTSALQLLQPHRRATPSVFVHSSRSTALVPRLRCMITLHGLDSQLLEVEVESAKNVPVMDTRETGTVLFDSLSCQYFTREYTEYPGEGSVAQAPTITPASFEDKNSSFPAIIHDTFRASVLPSGVVSDLAVEVFFAHGG